MRGRARAAATVLPATKQPAPKVARRTQAERREGTIRSLVDAATDVLIDAGYAGASVQRICERAGVSQGALFRHFATREALLVAVGEDVGAAILARYRDDFAELADGEDPLARAIHLLREACRSRSNQAWYELATAARTNDTLRAALAPAAARYKDDIERLARELLPDLAAMVGAPAFSLIVDTVVAIFDGEALRRFVLDGSDAADRARVDLLLAWVSALRAAATPATAVHHVLRTKSAPGPRIRG